MIRPHVIASVLVALALAACGDAASTGDNVSAADPTAAPEPTATTVMTSEPAPPSDLPTERQPLDFDEESKQDELSLPATGTLGVEDLEGGCVYVEIDGERYELLAGPDSGLAMDAGNGVVADAQGEVLARAGDQITVDGALDPGMATFCQIGPVLMATTVEAG